MVATSAVGVRALKNDASSLVRRASAGERIVILRYGRPQAVLGPADPTGDSSEKAPQHVEKWEAERLAFERLLPRLQRRFEGQFVAVAGGKVVDRDADHERLFRRVVRRRMLGTFFIGRVAVAQPIVDMPGFDIG